MRRHARLLFNTSPHPPQSSIKVRYSTRSKFFPAIEEALDKEAGRRRGSVHIQLPPGGYARDAMIILRADDGDFFETNWRGKDPTRFSARIRAAAAVLCRRGRFGCFDVSHHDGSLTITPR
jgi:hypothetical protein